MLRTVALITGSEEWNRGMAKKADIRPHILSSSQMAARLDVSKKTLDRMIKDGRLPQPNRGENGYRFWTMEEAREIENALKGERE